MPSPTPLPGMLARVRNRLAVVNDIRSSSTNGATEHLVDLDYVDSFLPPTDTVLWDLEPGAQAIPPDGYPKILETAPMRLREFEAVRRSVRWGALNAYVTELGDEAPIVAPFLGGVQVEDYQLVPLAKALSMPRVTLALFDDVGLGKTVEAGLVIGELIRRRRIRRVLVLCPAWLRKQWKDELESKFGLDFHLVDRDETTALRKQLGMETNPWATFPRVIASYHYLKQEDVLNEFLLASRSDGPSAATLPWDLLIVDEVHNCMPTAHGLDSDLAKMLARIGKLFEHKVFLSATPHNGFTQSFTGLLSQLDPVRFSKKDSITAAERRRVNEVVIRRLKKDINQIDAESGRVPRFVERDLQPAIQLPFGPEEASLIRSFEAFRSEFKKVVSSSMEASTRTAGNFLIEVLSKRLLSCPYTFANSWSRFKQGFERDEEATSQAVKSAADVARSESERDDETENRLATATRLAGAWSQRQFERIRPAIDALDRDLAALGLEPDAEGRIPRPKSDARLQSVLALIREKLDPAGGWNAGERLIIFTEYRTTLDYLVEAVKAAFPGEPSGRFLQLYGGMPDNQRESIKTAFNDPDDPVRVLFCTDAASEGANLQETARMVLHFDLPWNPSRVDQRNGRLDRHGQSRNVLIYHFTSDSDSDLRFLHRLFEKLETIREELGAMSKLFDEAISRRFLVSQQPMNQSLFGDEEVLEALDRKAETAKRRQRADLEPSREVGSVERQALSRFRSAIDLDADALRETLEVALGTGGESVRFTGPEEGCRYRLNAVPKEFRPTIDQTLRQRGGQARGSLLAVQFTAEDQLVSVGGRMVYRPGKDSTLLHLGHPLVRQAVQALSVSRFPGSRRYSTISRWSVTTGPVPAGAEAVILVTVEEMAMNRLRETFHQWVSVLRFPVSSGDLKPRLDYVSPDEEREGRTEASDRSADAKDLWADLRPDIEAAVKAYARDLEAKIRAKLAKEMRKAKDEQERLMRERREGLEKQLSKDTSAKRRELEELLERIADTSLFSEVGDLFKVDAQKIADEIAAEREQTRETLAFLESEHRRVVDHVIPNRFDLPEHVMVYPVAVEIRFPGVSR